MAGGDIGGALQTKLRGDIISLPVTAATIIYRGSLVALDTTGGLVQASDTAGLKFAGIAEEHVDNSAGALNDLQCRVRRVGIFRFKKNSVNAASDVGKIIFVKTAHSSSADEDVDLRSAVSGFCPIGRCTQVEAVIGTSHFIWVELSTDGSFRAAGANRPKISKTADYTLTAAEVSSDPFVLVDAHAITLPAAAAANANNTVWVASTGAGTVVCAAGFGGGGAGSDTVTLSAGMMAQCYSDGVNWYVDNLTAAA